MKTYTPGKNLSVLYLALVTVLYYILTSNVASPDLAPLHTEDTGYIEIERDSTSIIYAIDDYEYIEKLSNIYNVDLLSGDKVLVTRDGGVSMGRISGIKSLSLGVPIGVNSASKQDLMALPGIGDVTAGSIIDYRDNSGRFTELNELDKVPGIGEKTLESLEGKISLD